MATTESSEHCYETMGSESRKDESWIPYAKAGKGAEDLDNAQTKSGPENIRF